MIQAMIENHKEIDLAQMQGLFDLQKQYDDEIARKAFNAAKAKFSAMAPTIINDDEADFEVGNRRTQYGYATLAGTLSQIRDALQQCELNPSWKIDDTDPARLIITCQLTHSLGHQEETSLGAPRDAGKGNTGMNPLQAIKSTASYLERITLFALLGLAAKDGDDDGAAGGQGQEPEATGKPPLPDDRFAKNKPQYEKLVADGKKTAPELVVWLSTKYTLTAEQVQVINNMGEANDENS